MWSAQTGHCVLAGVWFGVGVSLTSSTPLIFFSTVICPGVKGKLGR